VLDNLGQVVRASGATAPACPAATISTALLFEDVPRQLRAVTELGPLALVEPLFAPLPSVKCLRAQLPALWAPVWTPRWLKAPAQSALSI
jgi:hypothetical protein